jgi:hypothetical protein
MNPGEFVVLYRDAAHPEWNCIEPDDLRFPAAVAALQALIRPSLDPRSGRVMAMREAMSEQWAYVSGVTWTWQS